MPAEWHEVALGELAEIFDGPHATPPKTQDGPIFLGISNLANGRLDLSNTEHLSEEHYDQWTRRVVPQPGDVVFSYETRLGEAAFIPCGLCCCLGRRMGLLRARPDKVDKRFLLYAYLGPEFQETLRSRTIHGSTVDRIPLIDIGKFPIRVPKTIGEQRAIARILGALDDKIELNRRMNETLEAMARALFKSWFADFDPVRAKAEGPDPGLPKPIADLFPDKLVDSDLGEIPEGWQTGKLGDLLAELVSGARPKGGAVDEGVPSIGAENVIGLGKYDFSKDKFIPTGFFEQLKTRGAALKPGDVLLYKDGAQIGRKTYFDHGFPHRECAINEHVFILRAKRLEHQRYMFFWLDQDWVTQEIISLNSNSAQPGINQRGVRGLPLLLPRSSAIASFNEIVAPLTRHLFANCIQSQTLAAIRDALLPKLISGEVRVREAERIVAGAAV